VLSAVSAGGKMMPVWIIMGMIALAMQNRINRITEHLTSIPEKTFRNYLKEEFPAYESPGAVEVYDGEDDFDSEFPEEPEFTVINPRGKD